jgi:predicted acyl esterase
LLRRQPWFTGAFATVGGSYLGFTPRVGATLPDWSPSSNSVALYGNSRRGLSVAPATTDLLSFDYDPADPTPTIGGRMLMAVTAGYCDDSTLAARADVLAFTGPVLDADP